MGIIGGAGTCRRPAGARCMNRSVYAPPGVHRSVSRRRSPEEGEGNSTPNWAPPSALVVTVATASWSNAICRTIARPNPEPPSSRARASSSRVNRSKTRSRSASEMPSPSSETLNVTPSLVELVWMLTTFEAWRAALSTRFRTSRCRSARDPSTWTGSTPSRLTETLPVADKISASSKTTSSRSTTTWPLSCTPPAARKSRFPTKSLRRSVSAESRDLSGGHSGARASAVSIKARRFAIGLLSS